MLSCNRWSLAGIFLSVVAGPLLFAQKETPPGGPAGFWLGVWGIGGMAAESLHQ